MTLTTKEATALRDNLESHFSTIWRCEIPESAAEARELFFSIVKDEVYLLAEQAAYDDDFLETVSMSESVRECIEDIATCICDGGWSYNYLRGTLYEKFPDVDEGYFDVDC